MWKQELAQAFSSVAELAQAGLITPEEATRLSHLGTRFKVRVTPYYASLMRSDADCPIRRQAIPALGEEDPDLPEWARSWSGRIYGRPAPWHADPIGDLTRLAAPRITHRYGNRAILHLSSLCAVYCRFCFRKEHLNDAHRSLYDGSLDPAWDYLARATEVRELILTGGDPLSLTDIALGRILERVEMLPQIRILRIHSRMVVTLPSRITPDLVAIFSRPRSFGIHLMSHFNHPREWTPSARHALALLRKAGVSLYNQNVLLGGVNDSAECLAQLYQSLYEDGVTPVYLHHPDWTPGTFHFRVGMERGVRLLRSLRGWLPGAALPQYVLDIPDGHGKTSLLDGSVCKIDEWKTGPVHGAVYEVPTPRTRAGSLDSVPSGQPSSMLYLDLFPAGQA